MYEQILNQIGLTKEQGLIYQTLLQNGLMVASKIALSANIKRSLCYKILDQLLGLGLVEERTDIGKISMFRATHPSKLKGLLTKREEEFKMAETNLGSILGKMVSDFNLISGKPNVQFFEGIEGIEKVVSDSMTSETEIYSYIDNEAVNKYIPEINKVYVRKRDDLKIVKKMISVDSPYIRERAKSFNKETTEVRVIRKDFSFATVLQIYDNKISYLTLGENKMIGVIIENPDVYQMHKTLFEYTWETAEKIM